MKNLDNTIKYYELLMSYEDTSKYINFELPIGFHFTFFEEGDELDWVNIHIESGEFSSVEQGLEYFHKFYDYFYNELDKRLIFIVDNESLEKIGTATISKLEEAEYGYFAAVDWVAIKKSYQGRKLSKPLITKLISVSNELGYSKIILHTQTTTWLAAKLYLDFGFVPLNIEDVVGWRILSTLTNHDKLKDIEPFPLEEIYDTRNILIENELNKMFEKDNFNYSVWYKDGLHDVYVYSDGYHEYQYYEEDGKINLKEVEFSKRKYRF